MAEYIDREALIKRLKSAGAISDWGLYLIKDEPAVDVCPVKNGHWEKDKEGIFQCSECKRPAVPTQYSQHLGNYCPNCGAKMDGEENAKTDN